MYANKPYCRKDQTIHMTTLNNLLRSVTADYIDTIDKSQPIDAVKIESDLMALVTNDIEAYNSQLTKGQKRWPVPVHLNNTQIALILSALYPIRRIVCADTFATPEEQDMLAIYQEDGTEAGVYVESMSTIENIALTYNMELKKTDLDDICAKVRNHVPRVLKCSDPDLIAVNNGIFNYRTKKLMKFDPKYVFVSKSHVNYNPKAKNPKIPMADGTVWDVESWIDDLFDNPELSNLIWQIMGAIIRPNVSWKKNAWFYSMSGNNGKGTLCSLMRNLLGESSHCSLSIDDFGHDFALEPLLHVSAIITDENNVGTYIDKVANFKAVCTNDSIRIDRKFKNSITYKFRGFMVQCINDLPKIKDKTDSFYRRQIIVPFTKSFTGAEKPEIKDDYLNRESVLEYVLYKILNMNYYTLDVPEACSIMLSQYKIANDPVREFVDDVFGELAWNAYPMTFLYDLYKEWRKTTNSEGKDIARKTFISQIGLILSNRSLGWEFKSFPNPVTYQDDSHRKPELLIVKYNLTNYMNPDYGGKNASKKSCTDALPIKARDFIERINKA